MSDYIDRNNAIECIKNEVIRIAKMLPDSYETRNLIKGAKDSIDTLKSMPSVDAVEVVRCKDCKWYQSVYGACSKFSFKNGNNYNEYCAVVEEDGFCKWGEKE